MRAFEGWVSVGGIPCPPHPPPHLKKQKSLSHHLAPPEEGRDLLPRHPSPPVGTIPDGREPQRAVTVSTTTPSSRPPPPPPPDAAAARPPHNLVGVVHPLRGVVRHVDVADGGGCGGVARSRRRRRAGHVLREVYHRGDGGGAVPASPPPRLALPLVVVVVVVEFVVAVPPLPPRRRRAAPQAEMYVLPGVRALGQMQDVPPRREVAGREPSAVVVHAEPPDGDLVFRKSLSSSRSVALLGFTAFEVVVVRWLEGVYQVGPALRPYHHLGRMTTAAATTTVVADAVSDALGRRCGCGGDGRLRRKMVLPPTSRRPRRVRRRGGVIPVVPGRPRARRRDVLHATPSPLAEVEHVRAHVIFAHSVAVVSVIVTVAGVAVAADPVPPRVDGVAELVQRLRPPRLDARGTRDVDRANGHRRQ